MQSVAGLTTIVKNVSGSEMKFSFLPPHGRTLAANEEFTFQGDIREYCSRRGPRFRNALYNALAANYLDIVSTPDLVLYDQTDDVSKVVGLDNGVLSAVDASWDSSV